MASRPLTRHASDELYGIALSAGLDADATLLTGCQPDDLVDADLYRRLASDLAGNRKLVIADLTGPPLLATLQGRVELLKLSEEELIRDGHVTSGSVPGSRRRARKHCAAPAPAASSSRAARIR